MISKLISLCLSLCMLITSLPISEVFSELTDFVNAIGQKISQSLKEEAPEKEFEVVEQANWDYTTPSTDSNGAYIIDTAKKLAWISYKVNNGTTFSGKTIKLTADLSLSNSTWVPIGGQDGYSTSGNDSANKFQGIFDGQGHTITGLTISSSRTYAGLFGLTGSSATIKNVGLISPTVTSTYSSDEHKHGTGALIGTCDGSNVQYCFVRGGSVSVTKAYSTGALIGATNTASTISYCYVRGTTVSCSKSSGSEAGILGYSEKSSSIARCYSVATLSGSATYKGQICPRVDSSYKVSISYCYSTSTPLYHSAHSSRYTLSNVSSVTAANLKAAGSGDTNGSKYMNTSLATAAFYPDNNPTVNAGYPIFSWERKYTITYNANGGSGAPSAQTKKHGTAITLSTTKPTRTGYTFSTWNTNSAGTGTNYASGASYSANATVTLYAKWTANSYTVTFNANGGTTPTASQSVTYASTYGTLPTPTRTGYTFNGWFTEASGGTQVTASTTVSITAAQTLYAHWTAYTYAVNYNANGGTGAPAAQTKTYDVALTLSATKPTRTGYTFLGWSTSSTATSATYAAGGSYTANAGATLYAVWKIDTYTVSYNANGGTGAPAAQTKTYGTALTLSSTKPTRTGYTFNGWNTAQNGSGTNYAAGASYTANAAVTLYAQWTANTLKISYNANGGSINSTTYKLNGSDIYTISNNAAYYNTWNYDVVQSEYGLPNITSFGLSRAGYSFVGWGTTASGGTIYDQDDLTLKASTINPGIKNGNVTTKLYAIWTPNTYAVTFNANGGTTSTASKSVTYASTYGDLPIPTREGYTFNGWFTATSGGTQVTASTTVSITTAQTLYAQWTVNNYTVTFDANEGSCDTESKQVTYNGTYGTLPTPTRKGYVFVGWYTQDVGGTNITPDTIMLTARDHTLYAQWDFYRYNLDATAPDAHITVSLNGEDVTLEGAVYRTELPAGTKITIKANLNEGETREFLFWRDDRMRIVSYSEEYSFVMEADKKIEAVYSEEINSEYYTVVFVDTILKTIVDIQRVVKGGSAKLPVLTTENAGYVFDKWDTETQQVNGNLIVRAIYRPKNNIHTIKIVTGETEIESKYYYNTPVTAVITDEQIPEGQLFAGWTFDGKTIASYEKEFRFYVYKDLTVTAVFTTEEVTEKPTVVLATTLKDQTETTYKAEFMVTRTVPENYVFVSSGLLLTQSAEFGTNDNLTFESHSDNSSTVRLYRTVHTTNDGQYQLTVKTSSGKTFYARGFVVYLDGKTGEIITLYTDVKTVSDK